MKFGEAIRQIRKSQGMSLRSVATACNCSHVHLHEVERGQRPPFADDLRKRVYDALELDESQRDELDLLRVIEIGHVDTSGLSDDSIRMLVAYRDELRTWEDQ